MRFIAFLTRSRITLGLALLFLTASSLPTIPAWGDDSPETRATLRGIKAVAVFVTGITPDAERDGLAKVQVQSDIELRLRKAGLVVDPSAVVCLCISLNLFIHQQDPSTYAFTVIVPVLQWARLLRDSSITALATTWSVNFTGTVGRQKLGDLRSKVGDAIVIFINAYLEQNPKQ